MKRIPLRSLFLIPLAIVMLLTIVGCQPTANPNKTGKKSIVVTYSILGSIVKDLVGDKASVTVSIPNGQDPHDWEPSAKGIEAINKADLVIQNGLGLESGLEKTLELAKKNGVKFFTATDHMAVRYVGQGEGIPSGDPDQAIGAADPHFWTDPLSMKSVVGALAYELKRDFNLDLTNQVSDLENRLDNLNKQVVETLAVVPESDRKLITGHESMGYFAQRYSFKLVGVIIPSLTSQAEVSAADLAYLRKVIQENQVKAIFTEVGTSPAVANTIAQETGAKLVELTTHALPPDNSYFTFINNLAKVIADSLK
jgi:zinc/manganese transport system substrate-binding protein